ncbi:MAG: hypothetical protein H6713_05970 [Myxococcales bacterium]|nr:hypothetical protein [Myxococcales bacterium]
MPEAEENPGGALMATADGDEFPNAIVEMRTPDLYEMTYMKGEGLVYHRAKEVAPWPLHALLGGVALIEVIAAAATWTLAPLLALPILALVWAMFSVLRVTVSEGEVSIQYGVFGPKIPIDAIESAEATTYDWKKFGGWGIKRNLKGEWIYNMPGDGGRAVRIRWTNAKGRRRVTLVGSKEPHELAAAIGKAQRRLPGGAAPKALPPER